MSENKYVLAMYDIKAKQNFIFNTNYLQEIIGGSGIIEDVFKDYLYPASEKASVKGIFHEDEEFSKENFEKHLCEGYIGEVVYEGGGNFLLLFKDVKIYREVTYLFTKAVLEKVPSLSLLPSYIEGINFDDYNGDRKKISIVHRKDADEKSHIAPCATLPIVQVDRKTSMPLTNFLDGEKYSKESYEKRQKRREIAKRFSSDEEVAKDVYENELDLLVRKKGEDSLLAIVYIDGNSMGAKVQARTNGKKTYSECVSALRTFSKEIQKDYIDDRIKDIERKLSGGGKFRKVLGAGDEINFICNAHDAFDLATAYLEGLPKGCSSCAGIAVFHSHAPYSDVYRIAEECCESGKTKMKELGLREACFIDFHYCQGAIDVSLDRIREKENTKSSSRPWLIKGEAEDVNNLTKISDVRKILNFLNVLGRSNVKGLAGKAKEGLTELKLDLSRISAHMSKEDRDKANKYLDISKITSKEQKMIYDIVLFYDLWFGGESNEL